MAAPTPPDPSALFREMLGQWEAMANEFGGGLMKSGEFARTMHSANTAAMTAKAATAQVMERALAAASMPSRSEIEHLSARLHRVEETVNRIEALLVAQAGGGLPERPVPKPRRTRTPPPKAAN